MRLPGLNFKIFRNVSRVVSFFASHSHHLLSSEHTHTHTQRVDDDDDSRIPSRRNKEKTEERTRTVTTQIIIGYKCKQRRQQPNSQVLLLPIKIARRVSSLGDKKDDNNSHKPRWREIGLSHDKHNLKSELA